MAKTKKKTVKKTVKKKTAKKATTKAPRKAARSTSPLNKTAKGHGLKETDKKIPKAAAAKAAPAKKTTRKSRKPKDNGIMMAAGKQSRLEFLSDFHLRQKKRRKVAEKKLNAYVDRLTKKYPKDFMDKLREELEDEDKFNRTVDELEVDTEHANPETEREYLESFFRKIGGNEE